MDKMKKGINKLDSKAEVEVSAPVQEVWDALINPGLIKKFMFGTDARSDWKEGSPITWRGIWQGKRYEDKGKILRLKVNRLLEYSHFSPLGGMEDVPENYHKVTIRLSPTKAGTRLSLVQDSNRTEEEKEHSEKNWNMVLESLKKLVEEVSLGQDTRELTLTRIFDSSPRSVWKAWTDPGKVARWWGPKGMTSEVHMLEARPGGRIDIDMMADKSLGRLEGSRFPMKGVFTVLEPSKKLVFESTGYLDGEPFADDIKTVTFEDERGKTKMTLHVEVTRASPKAEGPLAGMETGWIQTLDKLEKYLADKRKAAA